MGSVYRRGSKWWLRYKGPDGKWTQASSGLDVADEDKARKMLAKLEARIAAGTEVVGGTQAGPLLLRQYADAWVKDREARQIRSAKDDGSRLRKHVYPVIGDVPMAEVGQRHVRDLVRGMVAGKALAARTVLHVYNTLKTMFNDARVDLLVEMNPCLLRRSDLPKKVDKDPNFRALAIFEREEVVALCTSPVVPQDRRLLYAILSFAGLRFGEAAALRWSAYDLGKTPLGMLRVAVSWDSANNREKAVKTERPREVPVHPELARLLSGWLGEGVGFDDGAGAHSR